MNLQERLHQLENENRRLLEENRKRVAQGKQLAEEVTRLKPWARINRRHAEDIRQSEGFREGISRGLLVGRPLLELFLLAVECIRLMSGDETFTKERVLAVYGAEGKPEALMQCLQRQKRRLQNLEGIPPKEQNPNVEQAIQETRKEIARLKEQVRRGKGGEWQDGGGI